jgi:TolB-like protein
MYRHLAILCFCVSLLWAGDALAAQDLEAGIGEIGKSLAFKLTSGEVEKLAVIEFSNLSGYTSALDLFIAEELVTQLLEAQPGAFDVVERHQLAKVLEEQQLTSSSLFDAETISRVGKILGIQALVTGSIADLGTEIKIHARVISVATARVFAASSAKCPKAGMAETLLRQAAGPAPFTDINSASRQAQPSDVFFQNDFLRLTVESISIFNEKGAIVKYRRGATVALQFENLGISDLYLALEANAYGYGDPVRLVSNVGSSLVGSCHQGIAGLVCNSLNQGERDSRSIQASFSRIAGKSRSTVVMELKSQSGEVVRGNLFSLGIDLLRFESGRVQRFSVGIPNIQAQQSKND